MAAAVVYSAWFCPFAQRAWIGVLHRGLDIIVKEQDPYNKTEEWLAANPRGLVPALIHNDRSIYESTILMEYLDEAWPDHDGPSVFPPLAEPYQRFQARIWGDHINKKMVPPYYRMLQKKSQEERDDAAKELLQQLKFMFDQKSSSGKFFLGDQPGFVDFMLVPFALRYQLILGHYRNFTIPKEGYEKFHDWYANVIALDCVKNTIAVEANLIQSYQRYAEDTAQTLVATAIREGTQLP